MDNLLDLDELRRLCEQATPGPWNAHKKYVLVPGSDGLRNDDQRYLLTVSECGDERDWEHDRFQPYIDAEFIAAARNSLPALLSRLTDLTSALASASARVERVVGIVATMETDGDDYVEGYAEELRAALKEQSND